MATSYPGSLDSYATRTSGQTIAEGHVNDLQDAMVAIQTAFGATNAGMNGATNYFFATGRALWFYENTAPTGWTTQAGTIDDQLIAVKGGSQEYNVSGGTYNKGSWTADTHTHTMSSHVHTMSSHTHTMSSHTHSLSSHTHTMSSHQHSTPSHVHQVYDYTADSTNGNVYDNAGSSNSIGSSTRSGGTHLAAKITTDERIVGEDMHTKLEGSGTSGTNNSATAGPSTANTGTNNGATATPSTANTGTNNDATANNTSFSGWRPYAAVGIIAIKD